MEDKNQLMQLATTIKGAYSIDLTPRSELLANYKTVEDSIIAGLNYEVPTLNVISKEKGDDFISAVIETWILDLQISLNLKNCMDSFQMMECANLLIQNHNYRRMNICDINQIFKRAKVGGFGEFYESINIAKVHSWFETYFNERSIKAEGLSQREAQSYKSRAERNSQQSFKDFVKTGIKK